MLTDYLEMSDVKSGSTGRENGGDLRLFEPKIKKTDTAENRHVCQMFVGKPSIPVLGQNRGHSGFAGEKR